ncbi:hypothetical protein AB0M02_12035 [Actinoplanes sp. NPDC051861]|uniref:effector-associated constant component EACC1 n=1 Tax=Actinoplanes sp. NPDC051861 TaxID=3155170 RepID=UPI003440A850
MDVTVAVAGDAPADDLYSLRARLIEEDGLEVVLIESPAVPGRLGPGVDALQIVAGSVSSAFVASLVAWLRTRVGAVRVVVKSKDGAQIELDAKTVGALDAAGTAELIRELRAALEASEEK